MIVGELTTYIESLDKRICVSEAYQQSGRDNYKLPIRICVQVKYHDYSHFVDQKAEKVR